LEKIARNCILNSTYAIYWYVINDVAYGIFDIPHGAIIIDSYRYNCNYQFDHAQRDSYYLYHARRDEGRYLDQSWKWLSGKCSKNQNFGSRLLIWIFARFFTEILAKWFLTLNWTDVLQSGVMIFSLIAFTAKLWNDLGPARIIYDVEMANANRIGEILNLDPTKRSAAAWFMHELIYVFITMGTGPEF